MKLVDQEKEWPIYKKDSKVVGDNTDIGGFELGLKHINYDLRTVTIRLSRLPLGTRILF